MPRRTTARPHTETTERRILRSRGVRIPFKLALAATPLVLAIGGLLTTTVRATMDEADHQHRSAEIVATWTPLNATIDAVVLERGMIGRADADGSDARGTDASLEALGRAIDGLDAPQLRAELTEAVREIRTARANRRSDAVAAPAYGRAIHDLGQLGDLLAGAAADAQLGRDLQALAALQRVRRGVGEVSDVVLGGMRGVAIDPLGFDSLVESNRDAVTSFTAAAPSAWTAGWVASGVPEVLRRNEDQYLALTVAPAEEVAQQLARIDPSEYRASDRRISTMFDGFTGALIAAAERAEDDARSTTRNTLIAASAAVLVALVVTWRITRSATRRIRAVSAHAHDVATVQLPTLVEALRDPRGRSALPQSRLVEHVGTDEVGELADSFNAMQTTLVAVAEEQMAVLRRGVSDIFVTLARRDRSLVDRQLAVLDALEADVDDPKVLGDYFELDHLATRMRRNAESLLVLAHAETRHRRSDPGAIDDVVRAAVSEVEEYQRIDVHAVEPVVLKGTVVADLSHLLAELIDNAAAFSPRTTHVTVSGSLSGIDGYDIAIRDLGSGIPAERLEDLNDLLSTPPVIGLSVEPTLGLSVVSLLANKHGVRVTLTPASPGIVVSVHLPVHLFDGAPDAEPDHSYIDVPTHVPASVTSIPLTITDEQRLALDLAITAPTPQPRLRRLGEGVGVLDEARLPAPVAEPAAIVAEVLPARSAAEPEVPVAPSIVAPVARRAERAAATPRVQPGPPHPSIVQPPSSTAGSSPNDVRDPAAMLNIGRPLFGGPATAHGLPSRTPVGAKPDVGSDERSGGMSQTEQMPADLAAFARRPLLPHAPTAAALRLAVVAGAAAGTAVQSSPAGDTTSAGTR